MSHALEIQNLSMRFGGITAVSDLSLTVEEGQIFSVIGPNGAGKTTVFNVVTGIYSPSEGTIKFGGDTQVRPFTAGVAVRALLAGLVVAFLAVLAAAGVEQLWKAAVRKPFRSADAQFALGPAFAGAADYFRGRPGIVASANGYELFDLAGDKLADAPTLEEATALRDRLLAGGEADKKLAAIAPDAARHLRTIALAALGGLALGALGYLVVWNQNRRTPDGIAQAGIARTFQNIRLFQNMTVLENVLIGMDRTLSRNVLVMALRLPAVHNEEVAAEKKAVALLRFVGLTGKSGQLAKNLAYGDQRRLEIARALATEPKLLLLDEPAAGMNPSETVGLMQLIRDIRDRGVTVLLIEHHMNLVMGISDRVAVLDYGVKIAEGPPAEVSRDPRVVEAYLGKEEQH